MTWDKFLLNPRRGASAWAVTGIKFDRGRGLAHLRKRGEKFRWYGDDGKAVGPVQADLSAALDYAQERGWHDLSDRARWAPDDVRRAVRELIRRGHGALGGQSSKVYVSDALAALPELTKADLLRMHREGEISLTRLDLVQAAIESGEEQRLRASTIADGFAEYQLVSAR